MADEINVDKQRPPGGDLDLTMKGRFRLGRTTVRPSSLEIVDRTGTHRTQRRVMQMLVALREADGAPVTRDQLVERCWGGLAVGDDAITQCASKLRQALSAVPGVRVESVPRVGYRLVVDGAAIEDERDAFDSTAAALLRRRRAVAVLAVAAVVAAFGFGSSSRVSQLSGSHSLIGSTTTFQSDADRWHGAAVRLFRERSRPGYDAARLLLRRAIASDPRHAPSWARLAMTVYAPYWWIAEDDPDARARLRSEAIGDARRALEIDPKLAEAHQAMGFILWDAQGLTFLKQAVALNPRDAEIRQQLADLLEERLQLRQALAQAQVALELEPTTPRVIETAARLLERLGQHDRALALIDDLDRVTQRAGASRQARFALALTEGRLASAASQCSTSLERGDENRWWAQSCLLDVAGALHDADLRARVLKAQPKLVDTIAFEDAGRTLRLARTRPESWWADQFVGAYARWLLAAGKDTLLLQLYDDRFDSVEALWATKPEVVDMVGPPLAIALRRVGRTSEARAVRDRFAADLARLQAEGDTSLRIPVWSAELASLDGRADDAAQWLDRAISAGWKGSGPRQLAFDPRVDPVFALVRDDPPMQRAMTHFDSSVAREAAALARLHLAGRTWAPSRAG